MVGPWGGGQETERLGWEGMVGPWEEVRRRRDWGGRGWWGPGEEVRRRRDWGGRGWWAPGEEVRRRRDWGGRGWWFTCSLHFTLFSFSLPSFLLPLLHPSPPFPSLLSFLSFPHHFLIHPLSPPSLSLSLSTDTHTLSRAPLPYCDQHRLQRTPAPPPGHKHLPQSHCTRGEP